MEREKMASSENQQTTNFTGSNESLKLAVAIAMSLLRSKLKRPPTTDRHPPPSAPSESDALKWKRKAKERKQELLRLKEDLKEAQDGSQYDLFPQSASCKCYFFYNLGKLSPTRCGDGRDQRFNDVLRRRFLRQVRLMELRRKRTDASTSSQSFHVAEYNTENETEQLRASADFLVELCDNVSPAEARSFENWSHQAVDFILAALKNQSSKGNNLSFLEGLLSSLIMRMLRRMCTAKQGVEQHQIDADAQFYVQHLIRKLGSEPFIGQRVILSVSQRISVVAESLLFMDPFDDAFPNIHSCMYMMMALSHLLCGGRIQLIEFLVSDYLQPWSNCEHFEIRLFEEWVISLLHARKALELLESRNGLYVLYMDRVIGEVAKQVGQVSSLQKLNPEVLNNLFH